MVPPLETGISIVIPLFNSAQILPHLLNRLAGVLAQIAWRYEIILVNDGSQDDTWARVQEQMAVHPNLVALNMMRNYGQHNALLAGIHVARYPLCVTMDDDLQNPPEEVPKLLAALTPEIDVVYGAPQSEKHTLARRLSSRITKLVLSRSMSIAVAEQVSAFRLFRTQLRDAFTAYRGPFVNLDVLLTWGTTRFAAVKVVHDQRMMGTSNYTFGRLITHAVNMIAGFSVLPLQVASLLGIAMAVLGGLVLIYVVGRYLLQGSPVPGFPFLASIIAIFSGAQLLSLGVIGEYLLRIYFRVMDRPAYVVRTQLRSDERNDPNTEL